MLKNVIEQKKEMEHELGVISQMIYELEEEIDKHRRNPVEVDKQKVRVNQVQLMYSWRGRLNRTIEVNTLFGEEPNGHELVFNKIGETLN